MLIKNVHILPIGTEEHKNAYILIDDGIIISVGSMKNAPRWQDEFDANGAYALPGFIDAHTHLGLFEPAGQEANEYGNSFSPELRVTDGIDFGSQDFKKAIESGVTSVVISPGSSSICPGQEAFVSTLAGEIIQNPIALKVAFGENLKHKSNIKTRMQAVSLLREGLYKAQKYKEKKTKDVDLALDVLSKVLDKEIPLHAHIHTASDIKVAIELAKEFDIDIKLIHATEAYKVLDLLKENDINVITGPAFTHANKYELQNKRSDTPALLSNAGLIVAITTDHPVTPIENLSLAAALSSKHGLPPLDALEALTIKPAKILGVDNILGSIEPDKQADIVLFDKFPLELYATPSNVFVKGKKVF